MSVYIDLQHASGENLPIQDEELLRWAKHTLSAQQKTAELTLRFVTEEEMIYLNNTYRQQNKTTNVLAFPCDLPAQIELDSPLLGDVIICPMVLQQESIALSKSLQEHWAHIVIHGILHLLGFDHIEDKDAKIMQAQEIKLLAELGFANPYSCEENHFE